MTRTQRPVSNRLGEPVPPLTVRAARAALSSARIAAYFLAIALLVFVLRPGVRKEPVSFAVIMLSIAALTFLTFFVFGVLGYQIRGDSINAPRAQVWGFIVLIAIVVLGMVLWFGN